MEDHRDLEFVVLHHGPTTSMLASKDGTAPSRKEHAVKVRVASLAPLSPYVIHVANAAPTPVRRGTWNKVGVNFLGSRVIWRRRFVESDGTLDFSAADIEELLGEEITKPTDDIFSDRRHPFRFRAVVAFSLAAALVVLPMRAFSTKDELHETKNQIMSESALGVRALKEAKASIEAKEPEAAVRAFERAESAFSRAAHLSSMNSTLEALAKLVPEGRTAVSGSKSLAAVKALSSGAAEVSRAFAELKELPTLTAKVAAMQSALTLLDRDLASAELALADVDPNDLPPGLPVASLALAVRELRAELPSLVQTLDLASDMLGAEAPQRYLILFQNSHELRPTGGFVGSFALADVREGRIVNLEIPGDGSYNLQGRLTKLVAAPQPLRILSPRWEFQDANWSPDFPTSARKAAEFYAKAGGPSVDGVISVNSGLMEQLLGILGPVNIPGTEETVDRKNFMETAQRLAQFDYDRAENQPKAFLGKLAPELLSIVSRGSAEDLMALGELFGNSLHNKDLQLWARSEERAAVLHAFGWDGARINTDGDYVSVVNANIAGGKTDGAIEEHITDRTTIQPDGRVFKVIELTRTHRGTPKDRFTGDTNLTYHRLFVPKGSKLMSVIGSEPPSASRFGDDPSLGVDPDANEHGSYDVFEAWSELAPGEATTIRWSYELPTLPEQLLTSLSTVYDMQSGTHRTIKLTVNIPPSWKLIWHDRDIEQQGTVLTRERAFDHSFVSSLLFKR